MRNLLLIVGVLCAGAIAACAAGDGNSGGTGGSSHGETTTGPTGTGGSITIGAGGGTTGAITVKPAMVTLDVNVPGSAATQQFKAYSNGSEVNATWTLDAAGLGSIDGSGTFTSSGQHGGLVHVIAGVGGKSGEAALTIDLHIKENPGNVPPNLQGTLMGGGAADPANRWLYPYDKTLWPRGLKPPVLQLAGTGGDAFLVEVDEPHLSYQGFYPASTPAQVILSQVAWDAITKTAAAAEDVTVKVTKTSGGGVTGPVQETWTVAQGSVKGSVYYNTYDQVKQVMGQGAIMRVPVGQDVVLFKREDNTCTVCHSLSARGNVLVAAVDLSDFGGAFDVTKAGAPLIGPKQQPLLYAFGALSPQGDVLVTGYGDYNSGPSAIFDVASGTQLWDVNSNLGFQLFRPFFSPDGKKVVAGRMGPGVYEPGPLITVMDYDPAAKKLLNPVDIFQDMQFVPAYAIITPDGESVILDRGTEPQAETRNNAKADLWSIDIATHQITRLDAADGYDKMGNVNLPFGAEESAMNYEPTILPVTAGGYFWVVHTSRRQYGNTINNPDPYALSWGTNVASRKKLWVAPVDVHAKPGVDSSHPSIYLDGQDALSGNMRGFWSLDPCKADGDTCETGDECCGGACRQQPGGGFVCGPVSGCSQESEMCKTAADCCNGTDECIAGYCSLVGPK